MLTNSLFWDINLTVIVQIYKDFVFIAIVNIIIYVLVFQSLVEQYKAVKFEKESCDHFKKIFDNTAIGISIALWNGSFEQCNQAFCDLLGYSRHELQQYKIDELIFHSDREENMRLIEQVKLGNISFFQIENRYQHKYGKVIWVNKYVSILPDKAGNPTRLLVMVTDITEQKKTESERKIQTFYLQQAQELSLTGTWHLDLKTNKLFWTDGYYKIFGVSKDEEPNYNIFISKVHTEDQNIINKQWTEALEGIPNEIEYRILVNGEIKWVREKWVVEFDESHQPLWAIGVVQDITQSITIQQELQKQKNAYYSLYKECRVINEELYVAKEHAEFNVKQFRLLADSAPYAIFIQVEGKFVYVNKALTQLSGAKSQNELLGSNILDRIPEEYHTLVQKHIDDLNNKNANIIDVDYQCYRFNGSKIYVESSGVPFRYFEKDGALVFVKNITEKKEAEAKLKEQQLIFKTMFNAINDGIVITDTDRKIKEANKGMYKIFGYFPSELTGNSTEMLYADKQTFKDVGDAVSNKNASAPESLYLTYYKNKWAKVFPGEILVARLYDSSGNWIGNLGILHDISERVNYIDSLKQRNMELMAAEDKIKAHNEQLYETVEKLHQSELELMKNSYFFEQLYMQSAISTQLLDAKGWCLRINPKFSFLFGVKLYENEGIKYNILQDQYIIEKGIIHYLRRVFDHLEETSWEAEFNIANTSDHKANNVYHKEKKWFYCKAYPILDVLGNLTNVIVQYIDIDQRKQAENALMKNEQQLQHIFDNSPAIMFLLNDSFEIIRFNKTSVIFSEFDTEEIIKSQPGFLMKCINSLNKSHKCGLSPDCSTCSLYNTVKQSISNQETVSKVKTEMKLVKNGKKVNCSFLVSSSSASIRNEKLYLVTLEDITEIKQMEQKLLNTVIQTEESERKRIAQDLHDGIGPLLSTVMLYVQTYISSKNKDIKNTIKEHLLNTLNEAINQVSLISNNLSPHVLNNFGLNAAIQRVIDKTKFVYKITFDYKFAITSELKSEYNITFYRLVQELINNTLKHTQATEITIHIENVDNSLLLLFKNNGKVFNFEAAKNANKGMGLFNIINRIQSLGGKVKFSAGKLKGISYEIQVPI